MLMLFTRVGCQQQVGQGWVPCQEGGRCNMRGDSHATPSIYEAPGLHARSVHRVPGNHTGVNGFIYRESWYVGMCGGIHIFPAIERVNESVNANVPRGESARGIFVPMDRPQPSVELTLSVGRGLGAGSSAKSSPVVEVGPFMHGDREVGRCEIDLSYQVVFTPARDWNPPMVGIAVGIKAVRNLDYDLRRPR